MSGQVRPIRNDDNTAVIVSIVAPARESNGKCTITISSHKNAGNGNSILMQALSFFQYFKK